MLAEASASATGNFGNSANFHDGPAGANAMSADANAMSADANAMSADANAMSADANAMCTGAYARYDGADDFKVSRTQFMARGNELMSRENDWIRRDVSIERLRTDGMTCGAFAITPCTSWLRRCRLADCKCKGAFRVNVQSRCA